MLLRLFLLILLLAGPGWTLEAATSLAGVAATDNLVEKKIGSAHWGPCEVGDLLKPGDRIRTGASSSASLLLADKTMMRLAQNTEILIVDLAEKDGGFWRSFQLNSGRVWSDVTPGSGHFEVKGPNAVAAVKGTAFEVDADGEEDGTDVRVWEGQVECRSLSDADGPLQINANEEFRAYRRKKAFRTLINPVNADPWQKWNLETRKRWRAFTAKHPQRLRLSREILRQYRQQHHQPSPAVQRKVRQLKNRVQGNPPPRRRR